MNHDAGRWPNGSVWPWTAPPRLTTVALVLTVGWVVLTAGPAGAQTKSQVQGATAAASVVTAPRTSSAGSTKSGKMAKSGKPVQAGPAGPVAAKNVAVGAAAVPALPKSLLSQGCLDAAHGEWLRGELAELGQRDPVAATLGEPVAQAAFEAAPAAGTSGCVPFASVRSTAHRIESMALLPTSLPQEVGELRRALRALVVSRVDAARSPSTTWHDLADAPTPDGEVWVPLAAVLAGEAADQVPARWQREVNLLVRQMKRQLGVDDSAWVRLVFNDEGEAARLVALELVDETGQAVDSAIWLDRAGAPGGFVSARGGDHERLLWQAPVDYRRISRGVGAASVIVRKRVIAQAKTPGGKPRVVIRSFRTRGQHLGIDFAAPSGTPVVTVAEGTVVHAGKSGGYGNLIVVDHGGGVTTYYAHLSAYGAGVTEGARVERGQEIGLVGSTGMSTGPHLHYEIRKDGRYLDPADPAQTLPNWGLAGDEHQAILTRLLALGMSRQQAFNRAVRSPAMAAAKGQTAAAE